MRAFTTRLLIIAALFVAARVHAQDEPSVAPAEPEQSSAPAAAAQAPDEAPAGSIDAMSDSELGALGLDLGGTRVDTDFQFSGFADFTSVVPIKVRGATAIGLQRYQSFYVGNVNLYLSKNLTESFRMMGEVRLTYLPNGAVNNNPAGLEYQTTRTLDYANNARNTRWGGIILQRVYLEWTLHRLVTVRGGQFLTPFGIWNVDHGSPAYIPVQRPYSVNSDLFPESQTGLEMFGRWDATNQNTVGYHLTLSNGTGPISEYRDLDKNKAIGGRLYWEHYGKAFTRLGVSGYYGRDTSSTPSASLSNNVVYVRDALLTQSDNLALAADLLIKLGGLHLQAEWASQQRRYTPAGRTTHMVYLASVPMGASADSFSWASYALFAYHFGWYAITPYLMPQYNRLIFSQPLPDARLRNWSINAGLNINPIDAVTFKVEYMRSVSPNGGPVFKYPISMLQFQAAWAF